MKKTVKTIEIIGIICLVLTFIGFNFENLVSAQDSTRTRLVQQESNYVVEIRGKKDDFQLEFTADNQPSEVYSFTKNQRESFFVDKSFKLKYNKSFINRFQVFINGKEANLPKKPTNKQDLVEIQFDQNTLKSFPQRTLPPTPTPTPTVAPTPIPTPIPVQTLPELQNKIRLSLLRPEFRRGLVGIKVVSLETGKVIYEENAEKYLMPASNMKSYTVATALEKLTPNFRIATSVYAGAKPDANGVIKGDLTIYGRGDISMSLAFTRPDANANTIFTNADYLKVLEPLADKIVQAGVKKIEGNLVGDDSYFTSEPIPTGWEWDDLQWYYGSEISALSVLDNAVDLSVKPTTLNSPCTVQILPANTIFTVVNRCITSVSGNKRELQIVKKLDRNILEITGTMPVGDKGFKGYVTVTRPAQLFVEMLRQMLQQKGVMITGQNKVFGTREKILSSVFTISPVPPIEITKLESPPLSLIAAKTMKPSQNMFTETILRILGEQLGDKTNPKATSDQLGLAVVKNFLVQAGISADSVMQYDGSGLSRHNLVTPASSVQLYSYMSRSPNAQSWRDSLTIGGVDGTLKNRFIGTVATNNVRGKTGTIDQVSALSGYLTTTSGEKVVFSIIVNGVAGTSIRQSTMDEIVVAVANYNGKLNQ